MTASRPVAAGSAPPLILETLAWSQRLAGLGLTIVTLLAARDLPRFGDAVFIAASIYLLALIRLPRLWLVLLPLFCATIDLSPWTGRFLYSELDVFLWLTIAAALICARYRLPSMGKGIDRPSADALLIAAFVLIAVGSTSGLTAVLQPPGTLDGNPYLDPRYGYKVLKGLLWAVLLLPLWLELRRRDPGRTLALLKTGAVLAALGLLATVLWERGTLAALADGLRPGLASLTDLSTAYRTTGVLADMHTGGEAVDGMIVLLLCVCAGTVAHAKRAFPALVAGTAVLALVYVTLVGFTRSTYAAVALAISGIVALEIFRWRQVFALRLSRAIVLAILLPACFLASYLVARIGGPGALLLLALAQLAGAFALTTAWLPEAAPSRRRALVATLIVPQLFALGLTAGTMGSRVLDIDRDLDTRREHWAKVLELARKDTAGWIIGAGAGAFPMLYHRNFPGSVDWIGSFEVRGEPPRLVLRGEGDMHIYQRLRDADDTLRLEVMARSDEGGTLALSLCPRNILDTRGWRDSCDTQRIRLPPGGDFVATPVSLSLPPSARSGEAAHWPRALHLRAIDGDRPVEVARLEVLHGSAPLANSDFRRGMDSWFFTTGLGHLPYHIKNLWLELRFDQGWLGLAVFLAMFLRLGWRAWHAPVEQRLLPMAATAVYALGALGFFASPLDSARVSWLFYLLLFAGLVEPRTFASPIPGREATEHPSAP